MFAYKLQTEGEFMSKNNQMEKVLLGALVPFAGIGEGKKGRKERETQVSH